MTIWHFRALAIIIFVPLMVLWGKILIPIITESGPISVLATLAFFLATARYLDRC